jgi:UDP-galactopyranose mutase
MTPLDLVVFSHLPWDFVYQRPQHLLSRLAAGRRVIFIQEPEYHPHERPSWSFSDGPPGVIVARPQTPLHEPGFHDHQLAAMESMTNELFEQLQVEDYIAWFYTPLALPLIAAHKPQMIVYDCMDALDAFLNAPQNLKDRENDLLNLADIVFTGGPSLFKRLQHRHPNVHCFPSSVDASHFSKAKTAGVEPADQLPIPRPRLGYFGVIDERIDLPLIKELAQQHPDWQIVMVGPVVKIPPDSLPRLPNIHYLGQKQYSELPDYLRGWDVCLLPFALNDATEFISPTKTLEYMAAEKPIVSTPITDVAQPYGHIVYIARDSESFGQACATALNSAATSDHVERVTKMQEVLTHTSWDATAGKMSEILEGELRRQNSSAPSPTERRPVVVVGAGPTGLSAAYHLGADALLLEQNGSVGGLCRSIEVKGFTFDFAGHIMFSNDPYVHQLYEILLGENVHWQDREAWVFSKGVYTRYPFQGALYGLPPEVIKECIVGAIEARFGPLNPTSDPASLPLPPLVRTVPRSAPGRELRDANSKCQPVEVQDCCGDGVLESTARLGLRPNLNATGHSKNRNGNGNGNGNGKHAEPQMPTPKNFEEFIYEVWGAGIAKHFAIPYNRKLWAVPLTDMETSWLGGRVPLPNLEEMIDGALQPVAKPMGPNARFGYPLQGGFQALMNGFLPHLESELCLNATVVNLSARRRTLTLQDGREIGYEHLISTMPLPVLIRLIGEEAPTEVQRAARDLRYISVRCVNLGIGRPDLTEKHWIYYPEDSVFHRIFVQGNASPYCNPEGGFGLTCEITYHNQYKPLPCDGEALIQRCIEDCHRVGIFNTEDPILTATQVDIPHAYVVYDHARRRNVALIREWLLTQNIVLAGRYSEWEYYNSDHAFLAGKNAAERVRELQSSGANTTA